MDTKDLMDIIEAIVNLQNIMENIMLNERPDDYIDSLVYYKDVLTGIYIILDKEYEAELAMEEVEND